MATPTLVQHAHHKCHNPNGPTSTGAFKIPLIDPTLSGNCIVLFLTWENGKTVSITDDQSNTWPAAARSVNNGSLNTAIYVLPNATAGTRVISVTPSAGITHLQAIVSEWFNIATSSPVDGSNGANNSLSAGSFTPGSDGCLILSYVMCNDQDLDLISPAVTAITKGSNFTIDSADVSFGFVTQHYIQPTAQSINPAITITGGSGRTWSSVAVALKNATAGTAPADGIRIKRMQHQQKNTVATSYVQRFPTEGNLVLVGTSYGAGDMNLTAISDTASNTYTENIPTGANPCQIFIAPNATPNSDNVLTITTNAAPGVIVFWDVVQAGAYTSNSYAEGTQSGTNNITGAPLYTPTVSSGLVVAIAQFGTGPPAASAGDGRHDSVHFVGQDDTSADFDSGDGYQHAYNTSTSQLSFGYDMENGAGGTGWSADAWGFRQLATAALTGTVVDGINESDIVAGGKTAILTLTNDTFVPDAGPGIQYVGGQVGQFAGKTGATTVNFALTNGLASVPAAGDLVVVSYGVGSASSDRALTIQNSGATNYTLIDSELFVADTFSANLRVAYRFMPGTPETSVVLSGTGSIQDAGAYTIHVFRGVDSGTPLDVAAVPATGTNTRLADPASITPSTSGAKILIVGSAAMGAGGTFTGAYLTDRRVTTQADTNDVNIQSGYVDWTSGAYNPAAFGGGGTDTTNDSWCAMTVALRPLVTTPFPDARAAIRDGLDSAQSEAAGWDAKVKPNIPLANIERLSDTQCRVTLQAQADYDITATETITATVPASAVVGNAAIVATPTFTVATAATGPVGTLSATLGAATLSAGGVVGVAGATAATLATVSLSAAGTVSLSATLAKTLAALTSSASAGVAVVGATSATLGAATLSATGTVGSAAATGDLSKTFAALTLSSTGNLAVIATATPTLAAATLSAAGGITVTGTAAPTLAPLTSSATGAVGLAGTAAATLAPLSLAATGVVGTVVSTGDLSQTLAAATLSATGAATIAGTATPTLAALTSSAAGVVALAGTATPTLAPVTSAASGAVAIVGTSGLTLAPATLSATGSGVVSANGDLSKTLAPLTVSASGSVGIGGALGQTLGAMTDTAGGVVAITGTAAKTLAALTLSATGGTPATIGDLSAALGALTTSAAGAVLVSAQAAPALAALTVSGGASVAIAGTLARTLDALTQPGVGAVLVTGSAARTLAALTGNAAGQVIPLGSCVGDLAATLAALALVADGAHASIWDHPDPLRRYGPTGEHIGGPTIKPDDDGDFAFVPKGETIQ